MLGNEVKIKCVNCKETITLNYYGQEEWKGTCKDCGLFYSVCALDEEKM